MYKHMLKKKKMKNGKNRTELEARLYKLIYNIFVPYAIL